ncbi:MAG: hypothetical protein QXY10_02940 [Candidatus Micrarchaeaceae archaeon]
MKCAKHYCALVVKQSEGDISDRKLADFLENDEIGKILDTNANSVTQYSRR